MLARFRLIFSVLLVLLMVVVPAAQVAEAASVYSVDLRAVQLGAYNTYCNDDTCDESRVLYTVDFDVTERVDPITVDVYIFADTNIRLYSSSITVTGTLYTSSYVGPTGWFCEAVTSDEQHCAARIDQNTNGRITVVGREDAAYECASADHTSNPSQPPSYNRFIQADIYKHNDPTKSGSDSVTDVIDCLDGNALFQNLGLSSTFDTAWYPNGLDTVPDPDDYYFKPAGTAFKFWSIHVKNWGFTPYTDIPGPLTYHFHYDLPTYVTVTSCVVGNTTWPTGWKPTCTITNSGHTVDVSPKTGTGADAWIDLYATIGTPTGCPYSGSHTLNLFTDDYVTRNYDGSWRMWGPYTAHFRCS